MRKKKRKKKPRVKIEKGLDKIMDWLKNQKPKDLAEVALMGGLAVAGYEAFKDWRGALLGPVSLNLATAPAGTPPVSQIAGLAGLSILGVACGGLGYKPSETLLNKIPPQFREQYERENKTYLDWLDKISTAMEILPFPNPLKLLEAF